MKVLFVAPAFDMFPVGISYVASSLKRAGHEIHGHVYRERAALEGLLPGGFDLVATGGLSSQYRALSEIVQIAHVTGLRVVAGGGIISSEPELMVRALEPDFGVVGEGEETLVELLSCLERGGDPASVRGLAFVRGDRFVRTPDRKQISDLDALPRPDYDMLGFSEYLDHPAAAYMWDLFDHPREYPLITSRSCPFQCTFCYHPAGDRYRQRSLDDVMAELEAVVPRYRINIVGVYDELFSYDEERVYEFCRRMKALQGRIGWPLRWYCQMRVSGLKEQMLDAMRDSGCYLVSYGFESYSAKVLKSMKKNIRSEEIHRALHATLDRRISIQANFIFGDRAETWETANETLDFWREHRDAGILLFFILACPDSAMYRHAVETGIISDKLDFVANRLFDTFNMTSMSPWTFLRLRARVFRETHRHTRYVVPRRWVGDKVTVECPHCREVIEYGNYPLPRARFMRMAYCRSCRKRFLVVSRISRATTWLVGFGTNALTYWLYEQLLKRRGPPPVPVPRLRPLVSDAPPILPVIGERAGS